MSFLNNKPKKRKKKGSSISLTVEQKPVRAFNFGGSNKQSNQGKRGSGGLSDTGGAVFI